MLDISITGKTKLYGLIGNPVSHSISPVIQNSFFAAKECDSKYIALKIPPERLGDSMVILRENFGGFNVTIPHKQAIMAFLDDIDPQALLYGAVNTVKNDNGRLLGFNTDGYGFMRAFGDVGVNMTGKDVLVLGAGGGARAVLCELLRRSCRVTIINRTRDRAKQLQEDLADRFGGTLTVGDWNRLGEGYDCLVNTTPIGMSSYADDLPLASQLLRRFEIVYDLVYNPYETKLLAEAKRSGATIINGFPMLFHQAAEANRIWTDWELPDEEAKELYEKLGRYLLTMQLGAINKPGGV